MRGGGIERGPWTTPSRRGARSRGCGGRKVPDGEARGRSAPDPLWTAVAGLALTRRPGRTECFPARVAAFAGRPVIERLGKPPSSRQHPPG